MDSHGPGIKDLGVRKGRRDLVGIRIVLNCACAFCIIPAIFVFNVYICITPPQICTDPIAHKSVMTPAGSPGGHVSLSQENCAALDREGCVSASSCGHKINDSLGTTFTPNVAECPLCGGIVVGMLSLRDIDQGEELFMDYGAPYWETRRRA